MLPNVVNQGPPKWYVAYTFPKAEKKVKDKLEKIGIQSYLPLHQVVRDWSDRKKKLVVPLFPNYIFVHISENKRHEIFAVKEIVKYVSFGGVPATVNDTTVNSLKNILSVNPEIKVEKMVSIGAPVKITRGPFVGTEGIVVRMSGRTKLIIQIEALQRAITLNISASDVDSVYAETVNDRFDYTHMD